MEKQALDFFTAKASAVMTNVPGPLEALHLAGVRVAGVIPWVPRSGDMPIGLSIFSYSGQVLVGLAVDAALVPEPASILTGCRRSWTRCGELAHLGSSAEQVRVNTAATG